MQAVTLQTKLDNFPSLFMPTELVFEMLILYGINEENIYKLYQMVEWSDIDDKSYYYDVLSLVLISVIFYFMMNNFNIV